MSTGHFLLAMTAQNYMKRIIKNIPFHSFLIVPALIFFLFVHNYSTATFKSTLRSFEVALGFSFIIFFIFFIALRKNKYKAGVATTALMLILFFYGFIYELAEKLFYMGWWPFAEIHRYLLLVIFLFIIILCYFLFRANRSFHSLTLYFNSFVLVLFILNFVRLFAAFSGNDIKNNETGESQKTIPSSNKDSFPDIYYIILDGYANDSMLSEIYHYQENTLTGYLEKNNFLITSHSRTNYISTAPSLSSSLNYSYLDSIKKEVPEGTNLIYNNKVSRYLKQKGYEIVHVRSGYSVSRENYNADTTIALDNLSEFERTLLRYSIFRLDDLLGYARYKTLKEQLSVMYDVFKVKNPKYVFLHIVSPHPPYVCDENGKFKTSKRVVNVWWEPKKDYLLQLKFINSEVIKFISEVFKHSKRSPVIIVQSDHGPFIQSSSFKNIYDTRSMILNAYYVPYEWKNKLYPTITPVNSFRFVFNGLFNDSLPMLKDVPLDSATVKKNMNSNLMIEE